MIPLTEKLFANALLGSTTKGRSERALLEKN
jgi:hypothetical protein